MNEEAETSQKNGVGTINHLEKDKESWDINYEEINQKIEEAVLINKEEKNQLSKILWKHRAVFEKRPGRLSSYKHTLQIRKNQPFIGRSYPIPMAYRVKVEEEMQKMLNMGIIQRSNRPYINPIVPVIKRDGAVRLRLDARKLNEILIEDWECP